MGTITRINTRLNLEWEAQHAHTESDYGFAGIVTGEEFLALLTQAEQPVLRGFIEEAVSGNEAVERALLHYFQGMAVNAVHTCKGLRYLKSIGQQDEALTIAVHSLWETIKTYPLQRTSSVTGNLQMEMLKRITRSISAKMPQIMAEQSYGDFEIAESIHSENCNTVAEGAHPMECRPHEDSMGSPWIEVMRVLEWAVKTHAMSVEEAKLLGQYTSATTKERHELAHQLGLNSTGLSDKIQVLKRRLARRLASAGIERGSLV
ncbi:hypothetical protein ACTXPA_17735 [Glutamicibacter arilaitensis]|uniref:hypothetical protein n=1 Tax=Glutamicibacter arilaitensis TaxID=256701 RepID=UPI003FD073C6